MQTLNPAGWGWRLFLIIALALFLLHVVLLVAAPSKSAIPLLSNSIQLACGLLAAAASVFASHRMNRFGKQFWLLIATGFFVWSAAQMLFIYYDSILHFPLHEPWPSDVIFFLSMTPAFMTLFIDSERGLEWKDWPRVLDLAQVVILMVAAYLFTFAEPAHWKLSGGALARISWLPESGRDMFLTAAFILCALFSRQKIARDLYGRMAIFFVVYLSGELPYLYLQSTKSLSSGTPWDLAWSLPFVVVTILAATSKPVAEAAPIEAGLPIKEERWGRWGLVHILPMIFPLVVLLMSAGVAEKQLFLAVVMVLASFTCSSARILLGEREQEKSARALDEKNALIKSIFEGTGDAVYIRDLEGRYVIVNPAFAKNVGKLVEEIVGKTAAQLFDFAIARMLSETDRVVIETGQAQTFEYELPLLNGNREFLAMKSPYRDGQGKIIGVIVVARDITEYRAMQDRLRQSQKMEAIGTLAGGVAHDFNNLLMVISGYSSVLNDALGDTALRGHVEQIQRAGERAASLTRQLLAFSRKQTVQAVILSLNYVVVGMEKLLRRLIGEHITIVTHFAPDLGTIKADAGQIEQVILNLAVNARDAMPEGGRLTLETRNVEIGGAFEIPSNAIKPGRYVELLVRDTGVGMELGVQSHVFEPFFTTKPAGKGTGLGLSTVYGIVEQANGHITFSSKPGAGTTFRMLLPRIDSSLPSDISPEDDAESFHGVETVLLVEDDAAVCELVRTILTSHGYSVLAAHRPKEAEDFCETHKGRIDLLLSDVIMPEMSGAELSKRLKSQNPNMRVLFMSGYIDDSVVRQGFREYEVAFLQKPISPISLVRKVREVLDGAAIR